MGLGNYRPLDMETNKKYLSFGLKDSLEVLISILYKYLHNIVTFQHIFTDLKRLTIHSTWTVRHK